MSWTVFRFLCVSELEGKFGAVWPLFITHFAMVATYSYLCIIRQEWGMVCLMTFG